MAQMRKVWDNEKLALVTAVEAMKNLVIQTNPDISVSRVPGTAALCHGVVNDIA